MFIFTDTAKLHKIESNYDVEFIKYVSRTRNAWVGTIT